MVKKQLEQELFFDCNKFKTKTLVKQWIKKHKYKIPKCKNPIKRYTRSRVDRWTVKQRDKCLFGKAICCKTIDKGVRAVMGKLK